MNASVIIEQTPYSIPDPSTSAMLTSHHHAKPERLAEDPEKTTRHSLQSFLLSSLLSFSTLLSSLILLDFLTLLHFLPLLKFLTLLLNLVLPNVTISISATSSIPSIIPAHYLSPMHRLHLTRPSRRRLELPHRPYFIQRVPRNANTVVALQHNLHISNI